MIALTVFCVLLYVVGLLFLKIPNSREFVVNSHRKAFYSIIIPARNEESHLPALFASLEKLSGDFEVLLIDDHSTDATRMLMESFQKNSGLRVTILSNECPGKSPKKAAIAQAIKEAKADIIVTTDADCKLPGNLLSVLDSYYCNEQVKMVCGGVYFGELTSVVEKLQALEQSALTYVSSSLIRLCRPFTCNGANLSYRKSAYEDVEGFEGIRHIASGDDELLMKKIVKKYPKGVVFQSGAWVKTSLQTSWGALLQQRIRWASKWKYSSFIDKIPGLFIILLYSSMITSMLMYPNDILIWSVFGLKLLVEIFVTNFTWREREAKGYPVLYVPLLFIAYPFYSLVVGLLCSTKSYTWKGRNLK